MIAMRTKAPPALGVIPFEIGSRLWDLSKQLLDGAQVQIAPELERNWQLWIYEAVLQMGLDERMEEPDILEAESAAARIITDAIALALSRQTTRITWDFLKVVRGRICPLWPFCV